MSTTNKALRKQVDELSTESAAISALRDKAERLDTVEARNQELVSELAQLDSMRAELEEAHQSDRRPANRAKRIARGSG